MLFYGLSPEELVAMAAFCASDRRRGDPLPSWYVGTDEYERQRAEAERLLAEHLAGKYT